MMRRSLLASPAIVAFAGAATAQVAPLVIHTAGQGSPFVTYREAGVTLAAPG